MSRMKYNQSKKLHMKMGTILFRSLTEKTSLSSHDTHNLEKARLKLPSHNISSQQVRVTKCLNPKQPNDLPAHHLAPRNPAHVLPPQPLR